MNAKQRVTAASAAALLGLFLAGCDNTETEQTPEAPAATTVPVDEGMTGAPTGMETGMGEDMGDMATGGTGMDDMATGGAGTGTDN